VLENVNGADVLDVGLAGVESIAVTGGVVSTVHVFAAGVSSTLPASSRARTRNVCDPSASGPAYARGDVHVTYVAPSRLHSNVAVPSELVNVSDADELFVVLGGPPVSVVLGAVVSMVQVNDDGDGSTFPAMSRARTWNV